MGPLLTSAAAEAAPGAGPAMTRSKDRYQPHAASASQPNTRLEGLIEQGKIKQQAESLSKMP